MPPLKLEDLQPNATVRGILPDAAVTVVSVEWHGSDALTLVYRGPDGRVADEILFRDDEPRLQLVETGRPWSFDGDGALFRLVAEAHRIGLRKMECSGRKAASVRPRFFSQVVSTDPRSLRVGNWHQHLRVNSSLSVPLDPNDQRIN